LTQREKLQRAEIYKDHLAQVLLSKFLSGEIIKLEPVNDANCIYRYPVVEKIVGASELVDDFLKQLTNANILKRELYDRTVYCPKCGSVRISIHYDCPYCKSFNVEKSALVEHMSCGYIDTEEKFHTKEKLVCPRCNKELTKPDLDYRKAGVWCICHNCGKNFDIPVASHFCRDCHSAFSYEDAGFWDFYAYTLTAEARKEASLGWIMADPIRQFLEDDGYRVETPGFLEGKSGASHVFNVTASRREGEKETIVIDIATSTEDEVTEQPVIALFAKIYDVNPAKAYFIAIPQINENGKKMAKLYNINLIEAKDQAEAIKGLRTACGSDFKQ